MNTEAFEMVAHFCEETAVQVVLLMVCDDYHPQTYTSPEMLYD